MSELDELRKELQELKTQVSTVSRRLTELDSTMSDHVGLDWGETLTDANSPHPNASFNTAEFGGGVGRLTNTGVQFVTTDSGDAFASIPTGAGLNWFRIDFDGEEIGEIGGGYSTPGSETNNNMAIRVFPSASDGDSIVKVGIWNVDDWDAALAIQQLTASQVTMGFFRSTAAQTDQDIFFLVSGDPTSTEFTANVLQHGQLRQLQVGHYPTYQTSAYDAVANDFVIADGTFTVTLPTSIGHGAGTVIVKNAGTGTVTVERDGSATIFETVGGLTSVTIPPGQAKEFLYYVPDTEWHVHNFSSGGAMKTSGGGYYLIPAGPAAGTTVASSASADTYGSWTELRSASGNALYIVGASVFIDDDSTLSYVQFDIGTGAAASESSVGEFKVSMNTHDSNPGGSGEVNNLTRIGAEVTFAYPIPVAASTRIACRTGDSEASSLSHAITLHVIDQADLVSL